MLCNNRALWSVDEWQVSDAVVGSRWGACGLQGAGRPLRKPLIPAPLTTRANRSGGAMCGGVGGSRFKQPFVAWCWWAVAALTIDHFILSMIALATAVSTA